MTKGTAVEAIQVWEQGVQKEKHGSMGDAIRFYRQAIRLDENVEKNYRKKLLVEWELEKKMKQLQLHIHSGDTLKDSDEKHDINEDLNKQVLPCWILEMLPNDLLIDIISQIVYDSGESWVNLSLTCSKFNQLCFHDTTPFKVFKNLIYPKQKYDELSMTLNGVSNLQILEKELWGENYIEMIKTRPYIKFEGVYISTVNYLRYGSNLENSSSFLSPVHMITYYRYYRFYPDGKVLRLLTTEEPTQVVKYFHRDNIPKDSDLCHWSLGFEDNFGRVTIIRHSDKYTFHEILTIKKQGKKIHQRLKWVSSQVEDLEGNLSECSLRNEKPFYFSRVRSFNVH